jgi:hypothetical protein
MLGVARMAPHLLHQPAKLDGEVANRIDPVYADRPREVLHIHANSTYAEFPFRSGLLDMDVRYL